MELPILIEPIAGGRMRARLGEPFDVVAEADDAERAVQDLVRLVESRIQAGARVAALTLNNDTVRATVSPVPADNAYQADWVYRELQNAIEEQRRLEDAVGP